MLFSRRDKQNQPKQEGLDQRKLGQLFRDGDFIFAKGDQTDHLYTIQSGEIALYPGNPIKEPWREPIVLKQGDILGLTSLLGAPTRSITARAIGDTWLLSLDRKRLISQMHTDPSLAFRILTRAIERLQYLAEAFPQSEEEHHLMGNPLHAGHSMPNYHDPMNMRMMARQRS
ncbi:MAG: cyclic nucleotide-binding domain-containing protein [Magnetococcales bacterium]|nr:cyclic nucleotide-binding domain-containing protein [Magnetococcales bacterium]